MAIERLFAPNKTYPHGFAHFVRSPVIGDVGLGKSDKLPELTNIVDWHYATWRSKFAYTPGGEGGFRAEVPGLPGCVSEGELEGRRYRIGATMNARETHSSLVRMPVSTQATDQ